MFLLGNPIVAKMEFILAAPIQAFLAPHVAATLT